jgi:hypothetical protein
MQRVVMTKTRAGEPPERSNGSEETGDEAKQAAEFAIHEHIGRQLKSLFDEVAAEPIPQRLRSLLEELERKQSKS